MKMISWNVAGFRACLNKGFDRFFYDENPDIICLQEVKAEMEQIPFDPIGYYAYINPAEKKGYSGTLVYTKIKPINVMYGMNIEMHDHEGRLITLEYEKFYLICMYTPNVKRDLSRLEYRMKWEDDFLNYVKNLEKNKSVIICGDFNVAHTELDIKNAKANIGNAGFTYEEREKFETLLNNGFIDTFRYFNKNVCDAYTWWSYMGKSRINNIGWRIDYFVTSKNFIDNIINTIIYKDVLGSDHCPIGIEIKE